MYGLVNAALEDLVVARFGLAKWHELKQSAGVDVSNFSKLEAYPDALTYRLVAAAERVLGVTSEQFMRAFGEAWVPYAAQNGYEDLFQIGGDSLREFLSNLDMLHARVGRGFPKLRPPSFAVEDIDETTLRFHYRSERDGLCPMIVGMLSGLSARFATPLTVSHPVCKQQGADHCEFVLRLAR